jgi:hypothetical protein
MAWGIFSVLFVWTFWIRHERAAPQEAENADELRADRRTGEYFRIMLDLIKMKRVSQPLLIAWPRHFQAALVVKRFDGMSLPGNISWRRAPFRYRRQLSSAVSSTPNRKFMPSNGTSSLITFIEGVSLRWTTNTKWIKQLI